MRALIIVDVQYDFVKGGNLAVPDGEQVIPVINSIQHRYDLVVATQDWHPADHKSFASQHPEKDVFQKIVLNGLDQVLWPDHCVQGSRGAMLHDELQADRVEAIFRKGMDREIDSYSGFFDNGHRKSTGLSGYLKERGVAEVHVCGLAGDYCVYFTARDAIKEGFKAAILEDATRSISASSFEEAKHDIIRNGGSIAKAGSFSF